MLRIKTFLAVGFLIFLTSSISFAAPSLRTAKEYRSIPVKIIKKIRLPYGYHEGLFYDKRTIWICDGKNGKINIVNISSGDVVQTINPIAGFTEALTRIPEGNFILTDWETKKAYQASLKDGSMLTESEKSFSPSHPAGAVWADNRLFVITWTRGWGTSFKLIEMDKDLKLLRKISINRIQEPAHLAWDGKYMWITSWCSDLVYKLDIRTLQVLGYFPSPVSRPTGIAWDGDHFWVTGTYGDLYEVEVCDK